MATTDMAQLQRVVSKSEKKHGGLRSLDPPCGYYKQLIIN